MRLNYFGYKSTLLIISFFFISAAKSQTVVNATGNTIKDNLYYFEYSVGEISITTLTDNTNAVTQGLLQPNIKLVPPPCNSIDDKVIDFENPTKNLIRIVGQYDWITHYQVYAADGKLVAAGPFYNNVIDLTKYPAALYFIRLFPGCNGKFKVLKILKEL
jgi:hypothetical protein